MWPALTVLAVGISIYLHFTWRSRHRLLLAQTQDQQRRTAEAELVALKSSNAAARMEQLLESMSEGVILLSEEKRVDYANRAALQLFEIQQEVRGKTILTAFQSNELSDLLEKAIDGDQRAELELGLPGQNERVISVYATRVRNKRNEMMGTAFVFHDITRIRQLESTRQEFVGNVSHELRTPLSLIQGFAETLLETPSEDPEMNRKFLKNIGKHADRLTFLIEDLLTISALESGRVVMNLQDVDLCEAVGRVCGDLAPKAKAKGTALQNEIPPGQQCYADGDRLQQVLSNLVENAIKYGRNEGLVRIRLGSLFSGKIEVQVIDDGPGIPKALQARVFERFFRADKARSRETGGTGLGLAITKHIVQAHGGEVGVTSEPGHGTTFTFTIPAQKPNDSSESSVTSRGSRVGDEAL